MTGENKFATFVPNVPSKRLKIAAAFHNPKVSDIGGAAVRASDFRSSGRGFDSRPGRNQVT